MHRFVESLTCSLFCPIMCCTLFQGNYIPWHRTRVKPRTMISEERWTFETFFISCACGVSSRDGGCFVEGVPLVAASSASLLHEPDCVKLDTSSCNAKADISDSSNFMKVFPSTTQNHMISTIISKTVFGLGCEPKTENSYECGKAPSKETHQRTA